MSGLDNMPEASAEAQVFRFLDLLKSSTGSVGCRYGGMYHADERQLLFHDRQSPARELSASSAQLVASSALSSNFGYAWYDDREILTAGGA